MRRLCALLRSFLGTIRVSNLSVRSLSGSHMLPIVDNTAVGEVRGPIRPQLV
jgi:hypothetical protein